MIGDVTIGDKLKSLMDADCIDQPAVSGLTSEQRKAIEALAWSQIWAMREAREKCGPVYSSKMI